MINISAITNIVTHVAMKLLFSPVNRDMEIQFSQLNNKEAKGPTNSNFSKFLELEINSVKNQYTN